MSEIFQANTKPPQESGQERDWSEMDLAGWVELISDNNRSVDSFLGDMQHFKPVREDTHSLNPSIHEPPASGNLSQEKGREILKEISDTLAHFKINEQNFNLSERNQELLMGAYERLVVNRDRLEKKLAESQSSKPLESPVELPSAA